MINLCRLNAVINFLMIRMSAKVDVIKSLAAILAIPLMVCVAAGNCYADDAWYEAWDETEAAASRLYVDDKATEFENDAFDEIIGIARSGETDEGIKALNAFLLSRIRDMKVVFCLWQKKRGRDS